jgi:hypothetical protein
MAQKIIQHNVTLIFYDDTKYKVNVYQSAEGIIELVRLSDLVPVLNIYAFCIHWLDTTGITPTALATNFVKIQLP